MAEVLVTAAGLAAIVGLAWFFFRARTARSSQLRGRVQVGTGTGVAIEAADVTLVSGELRGVSDALDLSRATMRNIRQNLVFAFGYNAIGTPRAAGVLYPFFEIRLTPIIAAAAMALSSLSVVTNANRLRSWRRAPMQSGRR